MRTTTKSPNHTEEAEDTKTREVQGNSNRTTTSTEGKKVRSSRSSPTGSMVQEKVQGKRTLPAKSVKSNKTRHTDDSHTVPARSTQGKAQQHSGAKNQMLGRLGEEMACHYLRDNDFDILEQNWKCKSGEADIIADEDGTLVFIEVKTRSTGHSGLPEYAVTKQKRTRYEKIAVSYLAQNHRASGRVRFDVIAVQMTGENQCLLRHHRDAFAADV